MPDVRLELTMPPVGDGSFTGCWESTLPSPACVGTVPERLPRRRAAPQVARAGPSQKDKAQLLRCRGALIASPRAADRAEALPLASLLVAGLEGFAPPLHVLETRVLLLHYRPMAAGEGIKPSDSDFRDRRFYQQKLPRIT